MPKQQNENENEDEVEENVSWNEREDADDGNRFSQDDDDLAGRSWHGMNSEIEGDQTGRFDSDDDAEADEARKRRSS